ncbi:hypothetical protein FFF34_018925 [Inquilinus sp. KBS0705]|nr:hypothetical protein FFF34_018925 [Inquilinus sp. KBS0705]
MNKRLLTKYTIYLFLGLFTVALAGQLTSHLYTINQFSKITGKIIHKQITTTSYTVGGRFTKGRPVNSLIVTLDDLQQYTLQLDDSWDIDDYLPTGTIVTLYYPTKMYGLLSLDGLEHENYAVQVEANNKTLYSFKQNQTWSAVYYLIFCIGLFYYLLHTWYQDA